MKKKLFLVWILVISLVCSQAAAAFGAAGTVEKPKAPVMNSAVCADDGSVDVVWNKVSGADGYEVYRATSKSGKYTRIASVGTADRVYNDETVKTYKTYYYKIKTIDNGRKSVFSKVVSAYTEGVPIENGNMKFLVNFGNGEKRNWHSGDGVMTTACPLKFTVKINGKATDDYKVSYDKANVKVSKSKNGILTVTPKVAGNYLLTFTAGDEKGTFLYNAELRKEGPVTFNWRQSDEEQNSMSIKIPARRESVLTMKYHGKTITNFTVASSNKNVCTVKKKGSQVTVTNQNPGKCNITVTYKGQKTVFRWVVKRGAASVQHPYGNAAVPGSLSKSESETLLKVFAATKYSDSEIAALAKENLTLEEAAAKISTVQDAVNYLMAKDYDMKYSYNSCMYYNGVEWSNTLSSEFTFRENAGTCGGTSNLMNRLLEGDYDSQGYVNLCQSEGGHIFNYFEKDGLYYYCDFVGPPEGPFHDNQESHKYGYFLCMMDSPEAFAEYYIGNDPEFNDIASAFYLIDLVCYERDGKDKVPGGFREGGKLTPLGNPTGTIFSDEVKDDLKILFLRKGYEITFAKAAAKELWPPEINIPKD